MSYTNPNQSGSKTNKAVVKNADMPNDMQQDAVEFANQALERQCIEKDTAAFIKKEFDKKYKLTWHCMVGTNFGSCGTQPFKHFICFDIGEVHFLLFTCG